MAKTVQRRLGELMSCHVCCRVTASTHHPWYTTDTSFKEFEQMRLSMEPLLYQFGVDVFFNGAHLWRLSA